MVCYADSDTTYDGNDFVIRQTCPSGQVVGAVSPNGLLVCNALQFETESTPGSPSTTPAAGTATPAAGTAFLIQVITNYMFMMEWDGSQYSYPKYTTIFIGDEEVTSSNLASGSSV